ncbi:MAG: hypothetical protein IJL66_02065 [Lachnospiraceae bacterium]|nr:hypothetical protein [Lachnospiraceae bacterium]
MAKERSKFQRWVDGVLRSLFFEENGKPRSAAFLYSFLLALLFAFIYIAGYLLLVDPVEKLLSGASVAVRNAAEYLLPALVCSGICLLLTLLPGSAKRLVAGAYLWMGALVLAMMLFELVLIDWSDAATEYGLFMILLGIPGLLAVVTGGIPAFLLYRRDAKKQREKEKEQEKKEKERPSWYHG